jgi:aldose 1-epimerase
LFKIERKNNESSNQEIIELYNTESSTYAKILLNEGARMKELVIGNHHIIKDMKPLEYSNTYASSILFPFANRIKDGCYKFKDNYYQFDINEEELNNAIHGLVFNKTFEVINTRSVEEFASVKLVYHESKKSKGFPYIYIFYLFRLYFN